LDEKFKINDAAFFIVIRVGAAASSFFLTMNGTILVTGAGGFIGGHLVGEFLREGKSVRAVDKKPQRQWFQRFRRAENLTLNLEEKQACLTANKGCGQIYNLAADM
jgi:nucleoside-diphosphate-sugar epimerase